MRCGLLGQRLGHSYSPAMHGMLADYEYRLYEKQPEELPAFLREGNFSGLNVTMPYKKTVVPYCDALSDDARETGSVNTLVRRPDGALYGDNTDVFGFRFLVQESGINVAGKNILVLGSGGASAACTAVLRRLGAGSVTVLSRRGEDNYENLEKHRNAEVLVNTTPLGMFPETGGAPVDLCRFPALSGVLDVIYNPARTALLLQAEKMGIPHANGLVMLAAQAKKSAELFMGREIPEEAIRETVRRTAARQKNLILIGMPGAGKTEIGRRAAALLDRPFFDSDREIEKSAGMPVQEFFQRYGEPVFRQEETRVLWELGKRSGIVLATGGGCVVTPENLPLLHCNGEIVWLLRELDRLPTDGRPLSRQTDAAELYRKRAALYGCFADFRLENGGTPDEAAKKLAAMLRGEV